MHDNEGILANIFGGLSLSSQRRACQRRHLPGGNRHQSHNRIARVGHKDAAARCVNGHIYRRAEGGMGTNAIGSAGDDGAGDRARVDAGAD